MAAAEIRDRETGLVSELFSWFQFRQIFGFLIAMLETKVNSLKTQAEISAAERVQKKSAIALSR